MGADSTGGDAAPSDTANTVSRNKTAQLPALTPQWMRPGMGNGGSRAGMAGGAGTTASIPHNASGALPILPPQLTRSGSPEDSGGRHHGNMRQCKSDSRSQRSGGGYACGSANGGAAVSLRPGGNSGSGLLPPEPFPRRVKTAGGSRGSRSAGSTPTAITPHSGSDTMPEGGLWGSTHGATTGSSTYLNFERSRGSATSSHAPARKQESLQGSAAQCSSQGREATRRGGTTGQVNSSSSTVQAAHRGNLRATSLPADRDGSGTRSWAVSTEENKRSNRSRGGGLPPSPRMVSGRGEHHRYHPRSGTASLKRTSWHVTTGDENWTNQKEPVISEPPATSLLPVSRICHISSNSNSTDSVDRKSSVVEQWARGDTAREAAQTTICTVARDADPPQVDKTLHSVPAASLFTSATNCSTSTIGTPRSENTPQTSPSLQQPDSKYPPSSELVSHALPVPLQTPPTRPHLRSVSFPKPYSPAILALDHLDSMSLSATDTVTVCSQLQQARGQQQQRIWEQTTMVDLVNATGCAAAPVTSEAASFQILPDAGDFLASLGWSDGNDDDRPGAPTTGFARWQPWSIK